MCKITQSQVVVADGFISCKGAIKTLAVSRNEENTHTHAHTRMQLLPQSSNVQTRAFGGVSCTCCRKWKLHGRLKKQVSGCFRGPLGGLGWGGGAPDATVGAGVVHAWLVLQVPVLLRSLVASNIRSESVSRFPAGSGPSEGAEPQGNQTSDSSQRHWMTFSSPIPFNMNKKANFWV